MSGKRLSVTRVNALVHELERWREGQLGDKLSWAYLEKFSGFSRQALQANTRIKLAYIAAKKALRGGLVITRAEYSEELNELSARVQTLQTSLDDYIGREKEWQKRWQRIAYHLRCKGLNVVEIDSEIPAKATAPNKRETELILVQFDQPMLPTGRT